MRKLWGSPSATSVEVGNGRRSKTEEKRKSTVLLLAQLHDQQTTNAAVAVGELRWEPERKKEKGKKDGTKGIERKGCNPEWWICRIMCTFLSYVYRHKMCTVRYFTIRITLLWSSEITRLYGPCINAETTEIARIHVKIKYCWCMRRKKDKKHCDFSEMNELP